MLNTIVWGRLKPRGDRRTRHLPTFILQSDAVRNSRRPEGIPSRGRTLDHARRIVTMLTME